MLKYIALTVSYCPHLEENQNIVLAAMNAVELAEWLTAIDCCCSMGEGVIRRRHLLASPMASPEKRLPRFSGGEKENNQRNNEAESPPRLDTLISSISKSDKNREEVSEPVSAKSKPPVRRKTTKNKTDRPEDDDGGADNSSPGTSMKVKTSKRSSRSTSPSIDGKNESVKVEKKRSELPPRPHRSPQRSANAEFEDNEASSPMPTASTRRKSNISKLTKIFDKLNESEEDSQTSTAAAGNNFRPFASTSSNNGRRTPSPAAVEDDSTVDDNDSISSINSDKKRDSKGGGVKIVKFRNLLNSNGLDVDSPLNADKSSKAAALSPFHSDKSSKGSGFEQESQDINDVPEIIEEPKPKEKYNPKTLPIQNRPTGNLREGYLEKLDMDAFDASEDSWIKQFVSLDITAGTLCHYAEINGRKILRGRFNILSSEVDLFDKIHHGKTHAFKLYPKTTISSDGTVIETPHNPTNTAVFAADDTEILHYWLISFDDCAEYLIEKARLDELAAIAAAEARAKAEIEAKERAEAEVIAKAKAEAEAIAKAKADAEAEAARKAESESEELKRKQSSLIADSTQGPSDKAEPPKQPKDLKDMLIEHSKELHHVNNVTVEKPVIPDLTDVSPIKPTPGKFSAVACILQMSLGRIFNQQGAEPVQAEVESASEKQTEPSATSDSTADESTNPAKKAEETVPLPSIPTSSPLVPQLSVVPIAPAETVQLSLIEVSKEDQEPSTNSIQGSNVDTATAIKVIQPIPQIKFLVQKVKYPAERLARRIKIWYCSSGFSLSTEQEIEQFVNELQQTGDSTLQSFSQEKFDNILDWAHLLEVLRKYEGKMLVEEALEHDNLSNSWVLDVQAVVQSSEGATVNIKLSESSSIDVIARELAETLGVSEADCAAQLPAIITAPGNNPIQIGLEQLKDDLIFAEDLVLYQEEVIDHLWESYTVLKSVVEQKDDVINQLYSEVTDLKDKEKEKSSGKYRSGSFTDGNASNILALTNNEESKREISLSAVGGKEEWRNWADEKHKLIQSHNEVKSSLINEIRILRKTLNPNTEQTFLDLQKSENLRLKLEEELVKTQIQCDTLRSDLSKAQAKNQELETEKTMLESDWQDRYNKLLGRLDGQNVSQLTNEGFKTQQPPSTNSISDDSNKVSEVSNLDSALNGDPSVGIISRLNLVESKVKLFDNKFNHDSSAAGSMSTFSFPNSRSKSVYVPGIRSMPTNTEQSSTAAPQQAKSFPIDLSSRNPFPPPPSGNNVFNVNKAAIPEDDVANIQQLAERISSSSILVPSSNPRNSFSGGPTLSDLASFHSVLPPDDKHSLASAGTGDAMSYEEKKTAPPNFSSQKSSSSLAVTPFSQSSHANHSLALYDPSYPSSSASPRRQSVPKSNLPGGMVNYSNLSAGSSLMDPQQRQVTMRIPASAALLSASTNDHPLRNALRADTFNKLNGKGITMMTTRPYFKFNPKAKASYGESQMMMDGDNAQVGHHQYMNNPAALAPRFMSETSSSHKRTASWDANNGLPTTVSGRRVLLNRNSGGWKWK